MHLLFLLLAILSLGFGAAEPDVHIASTDSTVANDVAVADDDFHHYYELFDERSFRGMRVVDQKDAIANKECWLVLASVCRLQSIKFHPTPERPKIFCHIFFGDRCSVEGVYNFILAWDPEVPMNVQAFRNAPEYHGNKTIQCWGTFVPQQPSPTGKPGRLLRGPIPP